MDKVITSKNSNPLFDYFLKQEGNDQFAFSLAIEHFENMQKEASEKIEFLENLLEDVVFSSLSATFYEEICQGLFENPKLSKPLIEKFEENTEQRDQLILAISQTHLNYIKAGGACGGCAHHEYHSDVDDLIEPWMTQNGDFLTVLFIGMQTIQFTIEQIIYEALPLDNVNLPMVLNRENILDLRQKIFGYVEDKLL